MTTKSINRGAILRAAWSHARLVADILGRPIRSFIGATMRTAWALAKGMAPQPIPEMILQQAQQQQACAAPHVAMKLQRTVTTHGIVAIDIASVGPCPEFPDHGLDEYRVTADGDVVRTRYVLTNYHYRWSSPGARPFITPNRSSVKAQRTINAVADCLAAVPMMPQPVQQQQANAARAHKHKPKLFGYELTKRWIDEQGELREDTWPCVFGKPEDAAPLRDALIAGKGDPSFYGPSDAECGACLDIEAVYL